MPLRVAEAFILRTWPLRESDKIVSYFTREWGKCRGVARAARRPRSKFGSLLEPLTQVRLQVFEREGKELTTLDGGELVASMAAARPGLLAAMVLGAIAEVAERMLPEREVNDAVYRLLDVVLTAIRSASDDAAVWLAFTFYLYWMVRLGGFLPDTGELEAAAAELAERSSHTHLAGMEPACAQLATSAGGRQLRQFLRQQIEEHLEARLHSWPLVADLEGMA